ncbi:hypothetical protein D3P08_00270 [Paenibacillus nanensis]|uniref:Copper amine oxidase-like N-terminal domain-containing protein n=2 Tax=Paenibacillus nanensis TaxID=393251 RepID=A0A3A1VLS0_9BACL|nr:hypothetical protein D3P08_00270 [Paenibacillus nanensis]
MTAKDPSPPSSSKPDPAPSSKPVPTPSSSPSTPPAAEAQKIHVFFKGKELQFDGTQPIIKNGTTLVPFRKLFETLGFKVDWIETKTYRQAIGTKSSLTIKLTIDSKTAKVNDKDVALSVPAQIISGKTMVPLRFISENSGYQVSYSRTGNITTIEINNPGTGTDQEPSAPEPTTPDLTVEPYVVKGYLLDAEGNPIAGASVYADNTLQYDSNILGTTDDSGYYRLELPPIATTWRMGAHFSKTIEGKTFTYDIYADGDQPFAGNSGAIRNFTWVNGDGYIFVYPDFYSFGDDLPEFDINDVEITLTPIQNGKAGKPITKRVGQVNDGNGIDQLPIARYKATVRWLPEGHDPIPMLVRLNNKGEYAESVEFTFGDSVSGANTLDFKQELEISAP